MPQTLDDIGAEFHTFYQVMSQYIEQLSEFSVKGYAINFLYKALNGDFVWTSFLDINKLAPTLLDFKLSSGMLELTSANQRSLPQFVFMMHLIDRNDFLEIFLQKLLDNPTSGAFFIAKLCYRYFDLLKLFANLNPALESQYLLTPKDQVAILTHNLSLAFREFARLIKFVKITTHVSSFDRWQNTFHGLNKANLRRHGHLPWYETTKLDNVVQKAKSLVNKGTQLIRQKGHYVMGVAGSALLYAALIKNLPILPSELGYIVNLFHNSISDSAVTFFGKLKGSIGASSEVLKDFPSKESSGGSSKDLLKNVHKTVYIVGVGALKELRHLFDIISR